MNVYTFVYFIIDMEMNAFSTTLSLTAQTKETVYLVPFKFSQIIVFRTK